MTGSSDFGETSDPETEGSHSVQRGRAVPNRANDNPIRKLGIIPRCISILLVGRNVKKLGKCYEGPRSESITASTLLSTLQKTDF